MNKPTCTIGFQVDDPVVKGLISWKACRQSAVRYFIYSNENTGLLKLPVTRRLAAVCQEHEPPEDLTGYREISLEEYLVAQVMHA